MLQVVTPSSHGLVSLDRLKARLGITGATQDMDLLDRIQSESEAIEAYLRRRMVSERVRETFPLARGAQSIQATRYPITAVYSVRSAGMEIDPSQITFDSALGSIYLEGGFWGLTVIEYQGGYFDIPRPVQDATIQRIKGQLDGTGGRRDQGIKSERLEGVSSTTYFSPAELDGVVVDETLVDIEAYKAYFV